MGRCFEQKKGLFTVPKYNLFNYFTLDFFLKKLANGFTIAS